MKKQSFTLLELLIVIVVISILVIKANFTLSDTSLNQAADQVISHINYTRHLALVDNKFQYYPINNSEIEVNRTKYWFKQWWQIRFTAKDNGEIYYEIFSDLPYNKKSNNFDKVGNTPTSLRDESYAKNPLNHLYLVGNYGNGYPNKSLVDKKLNLTKYYSIKKVKVNAKKVFSNNSKRFIFDNYGNVYTSEGKQGDGEDINPYDKDERIFLASTAKISLCKDDNCVKKIDICISAKVGFAYLCK